MALNVGDAKDNSAGHIREWQRKNKKTFDFLWTRSSEPVEEVRRKLDSSRAPDFFVIGADGRIIASYTGFGYGEGGEDRA